MAVEPRQNRKLIGIVAGLLIAGLGLGGAILYIQRQGGTTSSSTAPVPMSTVVVAKTLIPHETKLDATNLVTMQVPTANLPQGASGPIAFTSIAAATGKYAAVDLAANEIVTTTNTLASPTSGTTLPPLDIPDGYVAMAIPDDDQQGVGGFIQAGDHIDILLSTTTGAIRFMLQDVKVLRVGTAAQQAAGTTSASLLIVTLPRQEAEALAYVIASKANTGSTTNMRYVLRPVDSYYLETTLAAAVSPTDTSIKVKHNSSLPTSAQPSSPLFVDVGGELMQVTAINAGSNGVDVWSVPQRGVLGAAPQAHSSGATVIGAPRYLSSIPLPAQITNVQDPTVGPAQFQQLFPS